MYSGVKSKETVLTAVFFVAILSIGTKNKSKKSKEIYKNLLTNHAMRGII